MAHAPSSKLSIRTIHRLPTSEVRQQFMYSYKVQVFKMPRYKKLVAGPHILEQFWAPHRSYSIERFHHPFIGDEPRDVEKGRTEKKSQFSIVSHNCYYPQIRCGEHCIETNLQVSRKYIKYSKMYFAKLAVAACKLFFLYAGHVGWEKIYHGHFQSSRFDSPSKFGINRKGI